ncbi:MAG: CHAT domain-containing tetratricopeptide repeat protein [Cyanobacteria bacterium P01_H01_bin.119]
MGNFRLGRLRFAAIACVVAIAIPLVTGGINLHFDGWVRGLPPAIAQSTAIELEESANQQFYNRQYEAAADGYRQALSLVEQSGDPQNQERRLVAQLGKAYLLLERYSEALPFLQRHLTLQAQDGFGTEPILSNLALAQYHLDRFAEAEDLLLQAIAGWEAIRADDELDEIDKITLFEQQSYTYTLMQRVLVAQGKTTEALLIAERSRARALVEQLVRAESQTQIPLPTLADIQQVARQQQATLVQYAVLGDGRRVLGNEIETETDLLIWVIAPSGNLSFHQVPLEPVWADIFRAALSPPTDLSPLESLVRLTRDGMGVGERGIAVVNGDRRYQDGMASNALPLQYLHQILIAPIIDQLPQDSSQTVVFIPQGPLFLVPFASLQADDGTYLINQHAIALSPSIQVLGLDQSDLPINSAGELVVGNPVTMPSIPPDSTLPPQTLPPLPGAEREAQAIGDILGSSPLLGRAATETAVVAQMPQQSIIHLATHGLLNLDPNLNEFGLTTDPNAPTATDANVFVTPGAVIVGDGVSVGGTDASVALARERVVRVDMPGVLALAPSDTDDGWLTAVEIANLELDADLVVLSACDTGRGRITGDGVVGLPRAFLAAGAEQVIVSLWQVPDAPTADLMVAFYQRLFQGQAPPQALQGAMAQTQATYPDPRNWSAFVLVQ